MDTRLYPSRKSSISGSALAILREERVTTVVQTELGFGTRLGDRLAVGSGAMPSNGRRRRAWGTMIDGQSIAHVWCRRACSCSRSPRRCSADFGPALRAAMASDERTVARMRLEPFGVEAESSSVTADGRALGFGKVGQLVQRIRREVRPAG